MKLLASAPLLLLALPLACATPSVAPSSATDPSWSAAGTWTDACCCKVSCPCLFGTGPTEGYCEGASLLEIDDGHYGGTELDGVSAIVAYRVKGWTEVVVDEGASPDQAEAFAALLPRFLPFVEKGPAPVVSRGRLEVSRGEGTVRYGTGRTTVELELLESANGEPIRLENLPAKGTPFMAAHGHTQYRSRVLAHDSGSGSFEWADRNGFTSAFELEGGALR